MGTTDHRRPRLAAGRRLGSRAAVVALALAAAGASGSAAIAGAPWSPPARIAGCVAGQPQVAFPSDSPTSPTGPGGIVWVTPAGGCGSSSAVPSLATARLDAADRPAAVGTQPLTPGTPLTAASGATRGRLAAAVPAGAEPPAVVQGRAGHRLAPEAAFGAGSGQVALARAYLGDVALAVAEPGGTIAVYVERHYSSRFDPPLRISVGPGAISSLTATMDYRADVLLAWQQDGALYAHMLRQSRRPDPTQRVGSSGPDPEITELVSDNDHGMVAWASAASSGVRTTSVRLALSATEVRFHGSRLLADYPDPQGEGASHGALALVRLSSENVVLAWTAAAGGHLGVYAAPAVFAGTRPSTLISGAGEGVLAALAAGPAREAVALYRGTAPDGGEAGAGRARLWASRITIGHGDRLSYAAPQPIGADGAVHPALAVDPATDRPVAAWSTGGSSPALEYAIGPGAGGYAPHVIPEPAGSSVHWLRITVGVILLLVLLGAGVVLVRRRRHLAR
jgi:hypothetical protein